MIACAFLGYVLRMGVELKQKGKHWEETNKRFEQAIEPMTSYLATLRGTNQAYSEEGFRGYLVSRGITYETWKAEIESLIRREA
jgi:hypothetical protein